MIASETYDVVLGSRVLGGTARSEGCHCTSTSRSIADIRGKLLVGAKLSEYHTGYGHFQVRCFATLPLQANSNDFTFDNEMLAQRIFFGFRIGEISCPTKYFPEASSISLRRSIRYGFGVL
jgi:hypothetical protein